MAGCGAWGGSVSLPGNACDRTPHDQREAEAILAAEWLREAFPQLDVSRAARGGALPPTDPPRIRTFAHWSFGRIYWLGSKYEAGKPILLTQEIHILAGHHFVMTIRYPVMDWQQIGKGGDTLRHCAPALPLLSSALPIVRTASVRDLGRNQMRHLRRSSVMPMVVVLLLLAAGCGRSRSYQDGFNAGQRLATLGIGSEAACKGAFILSSATDRNQFLEGCADGLNS